MNTNIDLNITNPLKKINVNSVSLSDYSYILNPEKTENQTGSNKKITYETPRCIACNVKLTLVNQAIACRCNNLFCSKHLFPENHQCKFDYKEYGRKILVENNPGIFITKVKGL
jgi:predicted nucleic acid binding AN1-type Zn finger protein